MREDLDRPLSPGEQLEKSRRLLEEAVTDFQAGRDAEEELGIRQRASLASERGFHALVLLANASWGRTLRATAVASWLWRTRDGRT